MSVSRGCGDRLQVMRAFAVRRPIVGGALFVTGGLVLAGVCAEYGYDHPGITVGRVIAAGIQLVGLRMAYDGAKALFGVLRRRWRCSGEGS